MSWRPHSSKTITPHHFTHCLNLCIFWLLSILLFCYCNINNWAPLVCMIFINFRIVRLKLNLFLLLLFLLFFLFKCIWPFFFFFPKQIYIYFLFQYFYCNHGYNWQLYNTRGHSWGLFPFSNTLPGPQQGPLFFVSLLSEKRKKIRESSWWW